MAKKYARQATIDRGEDAPAINYEAPPTIWRFMESNAKVRGLIGPYRCLSCDHEVLTRTGWVRVDEWAGQEILVWSENGDTHFEFPRAYIREPAEWFYHLRSKRVDQMVSPNHRIPHVKKYNSDVLRIATAEDVVRDHARLRDGWDGMIPSTFRAPSNANGISLSEYELRLMIAVCADGNFPKAASTTRCIICLRKRRKKDRLKWLLEQCGLDWQEYVNDARPTETVYRFDAPERNKSLAKYFEANAEQLAIIADEAPHWDGQIDNSYGASFYCSTDKADVDFVSYALSCQGRRAPVFAAPPQNPAHSVCYYVRGLKGAHAGFRNARSKGEIARVASPDGYQYCFTTSTGFFITRRNGKIAVTGNSGKSSGCCMEIFKRASQQAPGPDGVRRTRWAIVRDTYPNLKETALKTWLDWFPVGTFGDIVYSIPITYYLQPKHSDIFAEVIFLALDQPSDVEKLQSLELTGAWVNEAKNIGKPLITHLIGRVGQYPSTKDGGCTWGGLIMDTNPPDLDHWWPRMFGDAPPDEDELDILRDLPELDEIEGAEGIGGEEDFALFKQPSGLSPEAENIKHLNEGRNYYVRLARATRDRSFIDVYVHGLYGSTQDGKPVYPDFNPDVHVSKEPLEPDPRLPLHIGMDHGLTPACIVFQVTPRGQMRVLREIVGRDIDVRSFIRTTVRWHLAREFSGYEIIATGDPSGEKRAETDGRTVHQIAREEGIPMKPAPSQEVYKRIDAVGRYLTAMAGHGEPAFLLDPSCRVLRQAFIKGYRYKRRRVQGEDRWINKVDKDGNPWTHPMDALQYGALRAQQMERWRNINQRYGTPRKWKPADANAGY